MTFTRAAILSIFALVLAMTSAEAQQAQRLRGEIESVAGDVITVKTHDGKTMKVMLEGDYRVNHATVIKLADIKPGTFVGVGAMLDGNDMKAAQVQIFPPTTSARQRHGDWTSEPSGTMTNGLISAVVSGQNDGMLTVTAEGKSYNIKVPADVPAIKTDVGTKDLIKKGAWVGISNAVEQNGMLTTKAIIVSDDRRYPSR